MFHYVIQQLLAKLIFLGVLHKHPVHFVPALALSALLWRELEHLPLSGTQVKVCLLWDEPVSAGAGSRVSQPLELSPLPWKLLSRSKTAPVSQKNPCGRIRRADMVTAAHQAAGVEPGSWDGAHRADPLLCRTSAGLGPRLLDPAPSHHPPAASQSLSKHKPILALPLFWGCSSLSQIRWLFFSPCSALCLFLV